MRPRWPEVVRRRCGSYKLQGRRDYGQEVIADGNNQSNAYTVSLRDSLQTTKYIYFIFYIATTYACSKDHQTARDAMPNT